MRRIIVNTYLSLDGVMQAPGDSKEDAAKGFDLGGWANGYWDDRMVEVLLGYMAAPFDLLLGRTTYEIWAAHWPHQTDDEAVRLNKATKYVVSSTMQYAEWEPSVVIGQDVIERIAALKAEDGPELHLWGSSKLAQPLIASDLIDEYRLMIYPVLLGKGRRLFGDGVVPAGLRLVSSETSSTGVVIAVYEPAGAIKRAEAQGSQNSAEGA